MNGDPRLKPSGYFDRESDYERSEFLERYAEQRSERLRDDQMEAQQARQRDCQHFIVINGWCKDCGGRVTDEDLKIKVDSKQK